MRVRRKRIIICSESCIHFQKYCLPGSWLEDPIDFCHIRRPRFERDTCLELTTSSELIAIRNTP